MNSSCKIFIEKSKLFSAFSLVSHFYSLPSKMSSEMCQKVSRDSAGKKYFAVLYFSPPHLPWVMSNSIHQRYPRGTRSNRVRISNQFHLARSQQDGLLMDCLITISFCNRTRVTFCSHNVDYCDFLLVFNKLKNDT